MKFTRTMNFINKIKPHFNKENYLLIQSGGIILGGISGSIGGMYIELSYERPNIFGSCLMGTVMGIGGGAFGYCLGVCLPVILPLTIISAPVVIYKNYFKTKCNRKYN
jgi:hypothetical protein